MRPNAFQLAYQSPAQSLPRKAKQMSNLQLFSWFPLPLLPLPPWACSIPEDNVSPWCAFYAIFLRNSSAVLLEFCPPPSNPSNRSLSSVTGTVLFVAGILWPKRASLADSWARIIVCCPSGGTTTLTLARVHYSTASVLNS